MRKLVHGWEVGEGDWKPISGLGSFAFFKPKWTSSFSAKCVQCDTSIQVKFEPKNKGVLFMTPQHKCPGEWWLEIKDQ